jgi:transketolase
VGRKTFNNSESIERCVNHRRRILEVSQTVSALHIAPAFSCLEIVDTIYHDLMQYDDDGNLRDVFIMSKGHGYLAQLSVLEDLGVLPRENLDTYCTPEGRLGAHPDIGIPGVTAATGSLGHGLGIGLGVALAELILIGKGNGNPATVYVVLSDGELQEGSTWEAVLLASSLGAVNLVAIIDNNDFQSLGRTSETHPTFYPLVEKFESFGWESLEILGHDQMSLVSAVKSRSPDRPLMIVAKTTKGKGISFMENVPLWHYRSPNPEEYRLALQELDEAPL